MNIIQANSILIHLIRNVHRYFEVIHFEKYEEYPSIDRTDSKVKTDFD